MEPFGLYFAHLLQFTERPSITSSHHDGKTKIGPSIKNRMDGLCKAVFRVDLDFVEFFRILK